MSRPLRIEFPNAIYHVTSRGDRREEIYRDDIDRQAQLDVLAQAIDRFDAEVLAYCQMGNHFHLVLHTRQANLSRLMRHVNGVYTQRFNRRHALVGHLFQGRFKAILVDRDAYLLALCRYVERNPVAAAIVSAAGDWPWSSYRAHVGEAPTPPWLNSDGLHGHMLGRNAVSAADHKRAQRLYAALVAQPHVLDGAFWQTTLRHQIYLGDAGFVDKMQEQVSGARSSADEIPKAQRKQRISWQKCLAACRGERDIALATAYRDQGVTMRWLAQQCGLSVSHVSRLVAGVERREHRRSDGK